MNWLFFIPREGEYIYKQTNKTKHKQTNEQIIMQYTQKISYLIPNKGPKHVKKIVMKDFILRL